MIVRWRSKDGNFRADFDPQADISELIAKIVESAPGVDVSTLCLSNQPRGGETNVNNVVGRNLKELGLSHGDLLFVSYTTTLAPEPASQFNGSPANDPQESAAREAVREEPIDSYWRQRDGKIERSRDPRFCTHGAKAMCEYCSPLEPFDPSYHTQHAIKHLSFHSYLRKLGPPRAASVTSPPPLTPISYKVKSPCPSGSHPPWPASVCTSCQPSAITLQSQPFRMVDHLEFASDAIIDRFLQAWRSTGGQRFGWLIGHYEPYLEVPMGIKAVIEAIHEPPQEGEVDGLTIGLPWEDDARIRRLASLAPKPLSIVGQIFTDLTAREDDKSKLVYKRHPQSFYFSSLEVLFAARMQLQNPTSTSASPTGRFASRFVTAVLSGTESGDIDVAAYQVSEQACAMVDADLIEASVEPGIVRVKEEDRSLDTARYTPDVFFRYKNEYGRDVQKSAKPAFPVEYLLVNITHGFPKNPDPLFKSSHFPIENRPGLEDASNEVLFDELAKQGALDMTPTQILMKPEESENLLRWLSDWHLVAFIGSVGLLSEENIASLIKAATASANDGPASVSELLNTDGWKNLMAIARESAAPPRPAQAPPTVPNPSDFDIPPEAYDAIPEAAGGADVGGLSVRICPHCTYENVHGGTDCEVCGLPLG